MIDSPTGPNLVESNFLGVDAAGSPMGNVAGVALSGNSLDTIGGLGPGVRNVISASLIGVQVDSGHNKRILGNHIGMDLTGTASVGNDVGVWVRDSDAVIVGGSAPGERNVISGNLGDGVRISGESDVTVVGNYIGTDATGLAALGNQNRGVHVLGVSGTRVLDNVISGNGFEGVSLGPEQTSRVSGNLIGTDSLGLRALGNGGAGVFVDGSYDVDIGPFESSGGNTIAFNAVGVWMRPPTFGHRLQINLNSIFSNGGLGIVHGDSPVIVANTPGSMLNFPLLTSVVSDGSSTTIEGVYHGVYNDSVHISFFSSPACSTRPRDFAEGQTFLGSWTAGPSNGEVAFSVVLPVPVTENEQVTATAGFFLYISLSLEEGGLGYYAQTSPFSQRLPFSIEPSSGPAGGGTPVTILGTDFRPGAMVTIGGVSAGSATVLGLTEIQVVAPALPAGSANDVVVTNLDGTHGTLAMAWVPDFLDVPPSHPFHDFVTAVVSNGIAAGTGGGLYGAEAATLRQQMAVFLVKAKHGLCFTPAGCAGVFGDVPCSSPFAPWIEQLAAEGITGGCGGGNYCPDNPVTREQMAVFLLKAEHGPTYVPPPCTGSFGDVACPSLFADWIEQLAAESITSGCGGGNYCPGDANTRGQMAVFLTRTFNLQ